MKKMTLLAGCLFGLNQVLAQISPEYSALIKKADSLYRAKNYKSSAFAYSEAFKANGWKGYPEDRYNAACCWALANVPDSAFFNLNRIIMRGNFTDYKRLTNDADFKSLYTDKRWKELTEQVKAYKEKAEAHLNKPLVMQLDTILDEDQKYRLQMEEVEKKHGWDSKEMKELWKIANKKDSVNLLKVTAILDKYGWLGPDEIGNDGSSALFLVIQHSDQKTQEKYLPVMREAVKNKKASPSSLALLEDRVALKQGKKQIYGSQIGMKDGKYFVSPIEDPDNVDKRRAEVGLQPLSEYVKHWDLKWDVEEHKKQSADK
jgi:hypothetical protein